MGDAKNVRVYYLSGDSFVCQSCTSIWDLRAKIARRRGRLAPDIVAVQGYVHLADGNAVPPSQVHAVLKTALYEQDEWLAALTAHAKLGDMPACAKLAHQLVTKGDRRWTAWRGIILSDAAEDGDYDLCALLLANGWDANDKDNFGRAALHRASGNGHFEVSSLLLANGANVNAVDIWGSTALHKVATKKHSEVCSLLLDSGADSSIVNIWGNTACELASGYGHSEECRLRTEGSTDHAESTSDIFVTW